MDHVSVKIDGREVDFIAAVNLMDDDLREELHAQWHRKTSGNIIAADYPQVFADAYCMAHRAKYGSDFTVS